MFRKGKKSSLSVEEKMKEFLDKQVAKPSEGKSDLEVKFDALWKLLQEKLGLTTEELEQQILRIKESAKSSSVVKDEKVEEKCAKCGRQVSKKTGMCIYCGKEEGA